MGNQQGREADGRLTQKEIDRLLKRFARISGGRNSVTVDELMKQPELVGNVFVPRLFQMFDEDHDGRLSQDEFQTAIEYFAQLTTPEAKMNFAFRMYDINGDGQISAAELFATLKVLHGKSLADKRLEEIVKATVAEFDTDGDLKLGPAEFSKMLSEAEIDAQMMPSM